MNLQLKLIIYYIIFRIICYYTKESFTLPGYILNNNIYDNQDDKSEKDTSKYSFVSHINKPPTCLTNKSYDIICLIAFLGRHEILKYNIEMLNKQTIDIKIVLVVSNKKDIQFANDNGIYWVYAPNNPLGRKWQIGLEECRKFNPKAILINGSDDILSLNWAKYCFNFIKNGYDLVGKNSWYLTDITNNNIYHFGYVKPNIIIGAGRMISRDILDEINWNLFPVFQHRGLDTHCTKILNNNNAKIKIINSNKIFILSTKGMYNTLNTTERIINAKTLLTKQITNLQLKELK